MTPYEMQRLADTYAVVHGDTPAVQAARLALLDEDARLYAVGRPMERAA